MVLFHSKLLNTYPTPTPTFMLLKFVFGLGTVLVKFHTAGLYQDTPAWGSLPAPEERVACDVLHRGWGDEVLGPSWLQEPEGEEKGLLGSKPSPGLGLGGTIFP